MFNPPNPTATPGRRRAAPYRRPLAWHALNAAGKLRVVKIGAVKAYLRNATTHLFLTSEGDYV